MAQGRLLKAILILWVMLSPVNCQTGGGTWTATGSLKNGRITHTATLLGSGEVLVAGGQSGSSARSSTELYNPQTGVWTATGSLNSGREAHTSTLLGDGKVLVAGGDSSSSISELYDPKTGAWTVTGSLNFGRGSHTATLLGTGNVLVAGGDSSPVSELYDPMTGGWTATGSLKLGRTRHTATLLGSGEVLVVGGLTSDGFSTSSELYNPQTGAWTDTGSLSASRGSHTATLLSNGKVLVVGGTDGSNGFDSLTSSELYDPGTGAWTITGSLNTARGSHTGTLLKTGEALVAGGFNRSGYLSSSELYDPQTGAWTVTGSLNDRRFSHTATLLGNGKVLVVAGYVVVTGHRGTTAELYSSAPPSASCKRSIQLNATSGCSALPQTTDVDNGSTVGDHTTPQLSLTNADGTVVGPLYLGSYNVTLTVMDALQRSATCSTTITVVDGEALNSGLINCPGSPSPKVINPSQAGTATAVFPSTYNGKLNTKANGCLVTVAVTGIPTCDRCNSPGKHVQPDCQVTRNSDGSVAINASGGVGDYISWVTTVIDSAGAATTQNCGLCVDKQGASGGNSNCKSSWVPGTPAPC